MIKNLLIGLMTLFTFNSYSTKYYIDIITKYNFKTNASSTILTDAANNQFGTKNFKVELNDTVEFNIQLRYPSTAIYGYGSSIALYIGGNDVLGNPTLYSLPFPSATPVRTTYTLQVTGPISYVFKCGESLAETQQLSGLITLFNQSIDLSTSQMAASFPLDGNAIDVSGNGNNGTVLGPTPTNNRFGQSNSAMHFNSSVNDYIDINDGTILNTNNYSLSFWLQLQQVNSNSTIIQFDNLSFKFNGNNILNCVLNQNNHNLNVNPLSLNQWYHAVVTVNGYNYTLNGNSGTSSMHYELYLNGQKVYYEYDNLCGFNNNCNYNLGAYSTSNYFGGFSTAAFFSGDLDDIVVWKKTLTSAEVSALYNQQLTTNLLPINSTSGEFLFYPNPAQNILYTNTNSSFKIYDVLGNLCLQGNKSEVINLESLKSGVYFIELQVSDTSKKLRFIKE